MVRLFQHSRCFSHYYAAIIFLFAASLGCQNSTEESAVAQSKLLIATDTTLIPMSYMGDEGRVVGFEPDLIEAISKEVGFDYEIISVEWPGLFGGLITKKFDMVISSVTILEERKEKMAFSIPYLKSGLALVVRKETKGVESVEDLADKKLLTGAQVGTTAYFFLEKRASIPRKGYQVYGHAITDLINGEVDAVLGESTGTLYYKNQEKEYFQKIKMVGEILTEEYYGIVLRKQDEKRLNQINTALKKLIENGTVANLHQKWELGRAAQVPDAQPTSTPK